MPPDAPYRNPGSRHFIGEVVGDEANASVDSARLRDAAGSLRPLANIDTLLGQAERQSDDVARKTFDAAVVEARVLDIGARAGRLALTAFAEARGFELGDLSGNLADQSNESTSSIRATVEAEYADRLEAAQARIAELEDELDDLTAPESSAPGSPAPLFGTSRDEPTQS